MICGIVCSLKYPLTTRMVLYTRDGIADRYDIIMIFAVAIGPVTGRPPPWLLVWQLLTCEHVTRR